MSPKYNNKVVEKQAQTIATLTAELEQTKKLHEHAVAEVHSGVEIIARLKEENQSFGNVLAILHRDGGHYITKHGHGKASKDAIQIVNDLKARIAELTGALEKIGQRVEDVDRMHRTIPLRQIKVIAEQALKSTDKEKP